MTDDWHGMRMQCALLGAEIVSEERITHDGIGPWYFLKLDTTIISLGTDKRFADMLCFALRRNAQAFETRTHPPQPAERERASFQAAVVNGISNED